ncbi:MAG: GspH/FimT family pseudopilin [Gammaproteobacteria bacterium]
MNHGSEHGISLLEVLLLLVIMALLAAFAIPSFQSLLAKQRLKGAAETLFSELQRARLGAIQRNRTLSARFVIQPSGQWCLGVSDGDACHCDKDNCLLAGRPAPLLDSAVMPHIRLNTNFPHHTLFFGPLQGGARAGSIFLSTAGREARIVIGSLGRIRLCSSQLPGYAPC